jgi:hypothetical protein
MTPETGADAPRDPRCGYASTDALREGCSLTLLLSLSGNGRSQSTFSHKQTLSVIVAKGFAGTFQKRVVSQLVSISLSLSLSLSHLQTNYYCKISIDFMYNISESVSLVLWAIMCRFFIFFLLPYKKYALEISGDVF